MQIFSVNHWVPWKGKVRGNHTTLKGKDEKGGSRKGRRDGEEWGITASVHVLWSSVGFDLFRQTATSYEYVRWPRSATSDIRHLSSVIHHPTFVISFLVGAVMDVACLLASTHVLGPARPNG